MKKPNPDRIPSKLTRDAEGRVAHTYILDFRGTSTWLEPVRDADEGDLRPLVLRLLFAALPNAQAKGYALDVEGRALIDDLLDRHQPLPRLAKLEKWLPEYLMTLAEIILEHGLCKKRGRQSTPIYARSERDAQLECAIAEVLAFRRVLGRKRDDDTLVKQVADEHKITAGTLRNALERRRGSARRKLKRRRERILRAAASN